MIQSKSAVGKRPRTKDANAKRATHPADAMRREYDFRGGKRGKYTARFAKRVKPGDDEMK